MYSTLILYGHHIISVDSFAQFYGGITAYVDSFVVGLLPM